MSNGFAFSWCTVISSVDLAFTGRFASMNLDKIDGTEKTIEFFKNCIETQKKTSI